MTGRGRDLVAPGWAGSRTLGFALQVVPVIVAATILVLLVMVRMFRMVRNVQDQATTDDLTGLPNRRMLYLQAGERLAAPQRRRQALLMLDLDGFKEVNDSVGHHAGDELLVQVGARLGPHVRAGDLLVRLGGDEFAILLEDAGLAEAVAVAGTLCASLAEPFRLGGMAVHTGVSVGISLFPEQGADLSTLLRKADSAMYAAKASGGLHLFGSSDEDGTARLRTLEELRVALSNDELVLHYQPQGRPAHRRCSERGGARALEPPDQGPALPRQLPEVGGRCRPAADTGGSDRPRARLRLGRARSPARAGSGCVIDLMPEHVQQAAEGDKRVTAAVGDARSIDEPDSSADVVLLLGPLYHLVDAADRHAALREAHRVARPGALMAAAGVSRYTGLLDAAALGRLDDRAAPMLAAVVSSGMHDVRLGFTTAYFHPPEERGEDVRSAGFVDVEVDGVEGPMWVTVDAHGMDGLDALLPSALACARAVEQDPALIAASAHLLAVARR